MSFLNDVLEIDVLGREDEAERFIGADATILQRRACDIVYDDGDTEYNVPALFIRALEQSQKECQDGVENGLVPASRWYVGQLVEARFRGWHKFFPGEIAVCRDDGTFEIRYADGDYEVGVPPEMMRVPPKQPTQQETAEAPRPPDEAESCPQLPSSSEPALVQSEPAVVSPFRPTELDKGPDPTPVQPFIDAISHEEDVLVGDNLDTGADDPDDDDNDESDVLSATQLAEDAAAVVAALSRLPVPSIERQEQSERDLDPCEASNQLSGECDDLQKDDQRSHRESSPPDDEDEDSVVARSTRFISPERVSSSKPSRAPKRRMSSRSSSRAKEPDAGSAQGKVVPTLSASTLRYLSPTTRKTPRTAPTPSTPAVHSAKPKTPKRTAEKSRPVDTASWKELEEWRNVDLILTRRRRLVLNHGLVQGGDVPWGEEFAAIQSLKRFAAQHPDVLREHLRYQLQEVIKTNAAAGPGGRPATATTDAREALLLVKDLAFLLRHRVGPFLDVILPVVLPAVFHSHKRFLCDSAYEVLEALVAHCSSRKLVLALLHEAQSFPRDDMRLINLTCLYVEKCMCSLSAATMAELLRRSASTVLEAVADLLTCKSAACQASLQKSLALMLQALGNEELDRVLQDHLAGDALQLVRRHLAQAENAPSVAVGSTAKSPSPSKHVVNNAGPTDRGGGLSILQRMLSQRQNRVRVLRSSLAVRRFPRSDCALYQQGKATALPATALWLQSVRHMGRGPTVQGRKNATDAKRTAMNAKLARELTIVSKMVGGDRNNVRLQSVISKAKAANMTKDKIDAAIKRGVDSKDAVNAETVIYEATGPGGSALMIETLTDNKRRTAPALRHILGKYDGTLGTNGSVAWMFERKGYLEIDLSKAAADKPLDDDALMEIALEAGAEDVETRDTLAQVTCEPTELAAVRDGFASAGLEPSIVELIYLPKDFMDLEGEQRETFDKLIDALEDNEDVNQIHHNVNE
ncbi:hypothetical protein P43SY_002355 [Pythium insidiosum]|uniref:Uncharacterized protein n=1 Tax=Pythium insidiosum TaxID=114742 RepID=A0AAD5LQR2_PYTIN|nr:hypothetical protein P43SY_002355 [Pythium insidiosum]